MNTLTTFSDAAPTKAQAQQYHADGFLILRSSYNALSDGGEQRESHYAEFHEWLKDRYAEHGKTNTFFR